MASVEGDFEGAELEAFVAEVGGPRRLADLGDDLIDGAGSVDAPGEDNTDGEAIGGFQFSRNSADDDDDFGEKRDVSPGSAAGQARTIAKSLV